MFLKLLKEENPDKNIAVFMDEVEVSTSDKKAIMTKNTTTSLATLLTTLQSNTKMSWLVLSTSSLLDSTDEGQSSIELSEEDLKTFIETESMFKVTRLDKRVRNTSMVGVTAKQDVMEHYTSYSGASTWSAGVLQVATSHTVPGDRPVAVLTNIKHRRVIIGVYYISVVIHINTVYNVIRGHSVITQFIIPPCSRS